MVPRSLCQNYSFIVLVISILGTSVVPTLTAKNWTMTITIMKEQHRASPVTLTLVENFLHRMTTEQLSSCMSCGLQLQTLFLLPCACTICTECIACDTIACPICEKRFDPDDFQLLQVGLNRFFKYCFICHALLTL